MYDVHPGLYRPAARYALVMSSVKPDCSVKWECPKRRVLI
jgi:hypothetical protein